MLLRPTGFWASVAATTLADRVFFHHCRDDEFTPQPTEADASRLYSIQTKPSLSGQIIATIRQGEVIKIGGENNG